MNDEANRIVAEALGVKPNVICPDRCWYKQLDAGQINTSAVCVLEGTDKCTKKITKYPDYCGNDHDALEWLMAWPWDYELSRRGGKHTLWLRDAAGAPMQCGFASNLHDALKDATVEELPNFTVLTGKISPENYTLHLRPAIEAALKGGEPAQGKEPEND